MKANIPETGQKRVVIVGGGFAGLKLAHELSDKNLQVVLIDKHNYHQFQPLFYQVATAGLEPSAISFPFRKAFQKVRNMHVRLAEVSSVNAKENFIETSIGRINYDFLVIATGTDTNYFGNKKIQVSSMPMKSVEEALRIRNKILENYERALGIEDKEEQQALMNIVVVGGGPTGVEVSGTLAEMKRHILPKDYPELNFKYMQVSLIEGLPKVLASMSEHASLKAEEYLKKIGVNVLLKKQVTDYDGTTVTLSDGTTLKSKTLIWAAGVTCIKLEGLPQDAYGHANRLLVDAYNKIKNSENIYAIGDAALMMTESKYPKGHPQLAQTAMQQAKTLAKNIENIITKKPLIEFHYKDKGSLATVGRNLAVADLPKVKFGGFFAWIIWMTVHLMSIVGSKNRLVIFINWAWNYATYDQSLRLIINTANKKQVTT